MDSKRSANPPETLSTHEAERAISDQNTERQNRSHYALSGHRRGRPKQKNRCGRNAASAERVPADGRRSGQTRREFDAGKITGESRLQHDDIDGAGLRDAAGLQFDDIHAVVSCDEEEALEFLQRVDIPPDPATDPDGRAVSFRSEVPR